MDNLLEQLEQWNKNDEFSRCIEAIEAIPEKERGYKLTVLLGRAYSNLAVLGDHKAHGDDDEVDKELIQHSIDILETVWKQGENDPYWNARMGYAHLMADDTAAVALEYGKRWLELEPDNPEAQKLVSDCEGYLSEEPVEMYGEADWDAVEKHIEKYFGYYDYVFHESVSTGIHLDICVIPPRKDHNYYTLVTFGMGAHRMNVPEELTEKKLERAELLINLPPDWKLSEEDWQEEKWYWPIDVLKWIARIPVKDRNTWLGWGHTISSGEPFAESTKLCGAMLLNPGVFGEPSYFCTLPDGDEVNFYQLIPLYKEEMEFKLENSVDELIDKCPDEILEVINPTRLNAITDEDTIGYDLAEMDNAESHLKRIRDLHLPVDELAAYNSMAVYLRWAMERGQMSNPFLTQYRNVVETVRAGNGPDLRVFIRDKLDGKLSTQFFDRVGSGFAQWYAKDNRSNPYVYLWDYRDCALAVLKDHTWNSIEEEEAAYLLLPYTEESYQAISAILDKRLKEFLETEFEDDPELRVARAADGKPPIIPDWDGPLFCYATDRIAQKGYKIKGAKRIMPEREEWGWESGWGFFSDDDMMDDELDDEKAGFYDIRDICRIDPTVVSLLSLPYGTYMEKNETGEWVEIEDDETELMTMQLDKIEDVLSENLGEGYRIVRDNDELSPIIEWVDWVNQSENDENEEAIRVEVHFEDGTEETFEKGITLRQIWHEDVL